MEKRLSANVLKWIAVVSMTIDHMGAVLFPQHLWMRCVGRLAFILYAFLVTEGYVHTHDLKRYLGRLGLLALISEIPFDLLFHRTLFYWPSQNVFFTLVLGLLGIFFMEKAVGKLPVNWGFLSLAPVALMGVIAQMISCDYRYFGILMITVFYIFRKRTLAAFVGIGVIQALMSTIQMFGMAAFLPIALYNGKKGRGGKVLQWLFYFYYPAHMAAIYMAGSLLGII